MYFASFLTLTEIQIKLDQVFMQEMLEKKVDISIDTETFPKVFQQESVEAKQVSQSVRHCRNKNMPNKPEARGCGYWLRMVFFFVPLVSVGYCVPVLCHHFPGFHSHSCSGPPRSFSALLFLLL